MEDNISAITTARASKVEVSVRAEHVPDVILPDGAYYFGYQITIHNIGKTPFRLISRRWRITDGNGKTREISGEGVIGKQPRITPSYAFTYASYVDLPTPAGSMEGIYLMRTDEDDEFEAEIPRFSLYVPGKVH